MGKNIPVISEDTQKLFNLKMTSTVLICIVLSVSIFVIYLQVRHYDFIDLDDTLYITDNIHVRKGITFENIKWAFTTSHGGYWIPVTWLSHMLDCQLFGMNAGNHHLMNLYFHILNTILLFLFFRKTTRNLWQSAFLAVLFAIHPLHVESVAWIAERKDMLSTFFLLLTLHMYVRYVEKSGVVYYIASLLFFALGLMAKPMIVTLPFILLLMDYWPLGRFPYFSSSTGGKKAETSPASASVLIGEKIPFFLFALLSGAITFLFHFDRGALAPFSTLPMDIRIANAFVSYMFYIVKMFFPFDLAVLYPFSTDIPIWQIISACCFIVIVTLLTVRLANKFPYLLTGWLWYLISLLPVIGLLQPGFQARADRFTYIPLIGLFIIPAWGIPVLFKNVKLKKAFLSTTTMMTVILLSIITYIQIGYWSGSIPLFKHTLDVTVDNYLINHNLNVALRKAGKYREADRYYYDALWIRYGPGVKTQEIFGNALIDQGRYDDAIDYFTNVLKENPDDPTLLINIGNAFAAKGMLNKAAEKYLRVLELQPGSAEAQNNLGLVFLRKGALENAVTCFKEALRLNSDFINARHNLNKTLADLKKIQDAVEKMQNALDIDPEDKGLKTKLRILSDKKLNLERIVDQFERSLSIQPGYKNSKGGEPPVVKGIKTEYRNRLPVFERIIQLNRRNADAYYHAACMYSLKGDKNKSTALFKKAIENGFRNLDLFLIDNDLSHIKKSQNYDAFVEKITKN